MSARRAGTCGEPGPGSSHCTDYRCHSYSCYDAGDDVSWNDSQWEYFDLTPHQCTDAECPGRSAANR